MTKKTVWRTAYAEVRRPMKCIVALLIAILCCAVYPRDIESYPMHPAGAKMPAEVTLTEHYLRFIPTVVQIALPVVLGDKVGMAQLVYAGISTTIVTHGVKHLLNDRWVMGTRLGRRPASATSRHNMPSGHSSMVSCAIWFIGRRYSFRLALALSIFMLLTMYARVMLNDHTISAVIAGALVGFMCTALFTSPWRKRLPALRLAPAAGQAPSTI